MIKITEWPAHVRFLSNGQEDGKTWARYTDEEHDYLTIYDPREDKEQLFIIPCKSNRTPARNGERPHTLPTPAGMPAGARR